MQFFELNRHIIEVSKTFKKFGPIRIYKEVLEIVGDQEKADEFMLSEFGGFTPGELTDIKYRIGYYKNIKSMNPS